MYSLLVLLIGLFGTIHGECEESYMTFCDCLTDLNNHKIHNWTDVVIGSTKSKNNYCSSSKIDDSTFENFEELKSLIVLNQIEYIEKDAFDATAVRETLKVVQFYANNLKNIGTGTFSGFRKLSRLSLVNNNVECIEEYAFRSSVIKNLDLSRNNIQTIKPETFAGCRVSRIIIRNNRLSTINSNAFNEYLTVLNLDYNNIIIIPNGFMENSRELEELTMSHNKLSHVSGIDSIENLKKLDFSSNKINFINDAQLEELKHLQYLDLSNNKLEKFSLKTLKKVKAAEMTLLLSYNLLTNLKMKGAKPLTLTLFGNPWNCDCLSKLENNMKLYNFRRTKCDVELFRTGNFPICLDQGDCKGAPPVQNRNDLRRFLEAVDLRKKNLSCDLFREVGAKYVVNAGATADNHLGG